MRARFSSCMSRAHFVCHMEFILFIFLEHGNYKRGKVVTSEILKNISTKSYFSFMSMVFFIVCGLARGMRRQVRVVLTFDVG